MKCNNNDIKLIYNSVLRLTFSCDLLIRKKEKLNVTDLRKNSEPQLRFKDCYVILKEILLTEDNMNSCFWDSCLNERHSFDVKTALRFATLRAGICNNQPTHWKMSMICRIFFFAHNPCMIFFSSELTVHDFFPSLGGCREFFFQIFQPPPSKVKWFAP